MAIPWQVGLIKILSLRGGIIELNICERYHVIEGFEDYYITESGRVFSYRNGKTGWKGLREIKLKGINDPKRYLQVSLSKNGEITYVQVHRLVAKYFCNGYFDGAVVNHINANIHDNRCENLEWVSIKENIHKSYITSGVSQTRHYYYYDLIDPIGNIIGRFVGMNSVAKYVRENGLNASPSSLKRYYVSRGYELRKV